MKIISMNQVAYFATANENEKKRIIRNQIEKPGYLVIPYSSARSTLTKFYKYGMNATILDEGKMKTALRAKDTKWQINDISNCINAIDVFASMEQPVHLMGKKFTIKSEAAKKIELNNVVISVNPDVVFIVETEDGFRAGAIKFRISKNGKFELINSQLVACILEQSLKKEFKDSLIQVDKSYCLCIDVFNRRITPAPEEDRMVLELLMQTLDEIAGKWKDAA